MRRQGGRSRRNLALGGNDQEDRVAPLFLLDGDGAEELNVLKAVLFEDRAERVAIESGVEDAFGILGVEAAVLGVEVRQSDPGAGLEVLGKALDQQVGVLDVMHGHGTDDEIELPVDRLLQDVLAQDIDLALELVLGGELFQHRLGDVQRRHALHGIGDVRGDEPCASTEIENLHARVELDVVDNAGADAGGELHWNVSLVEIFCLFLEQICHWFYSHLKKLVWHWSSGEPRGFSAATCPDQPCWPAESRGPQMNRIDNEKHGASPAQAEGHVEIASLLGQVSEAEWKIRVDLAAAYRLVAHYGWDDLIFTHLSARIPGPEHHFLLNPYQLMFEEVTASSLVKVNVEGNPVEPTPFITNPAGFTIHSALHMAREDAQAVMHLHTPAGQAVSAHADGLLPLTQTAMLVRSELAFHDYEGVAVNLEERERLVADMGDKSGMLLGNHGTLAVGANVGECFIRLYFIERACQAQVMALSAGDRINQPPPGAPELTREQGSEGLRLVANALAWPALLRKAYRLDPGFAT